MKKDKIQRMNRYMDEVYSQMINANYDQKKLNKAFLVFNLCSFSDVKETFNWIFEILLEMNLKVENYQTCHFISGVQKKLNRTRKC